MSVEVKNLETIIPQWMFDALSEKEIQGILRDIGDGAYNEWIRLAGQTFSTTLQDYVSGIQPIEVKPGQVTIALVGELPHLLEEGVPDIDMHDTLLGPKVPIAPPGRFGKHLKIDPRTFATGFYRAIPFRHATPGTKQQPRAGQVGVEMGKQYGGHKEVADAKALGKAVYARAQKLKATTSHPDAGTVYGGRLPAGLAPKLKPHHKTDIFAGMIREQKTYAKGKGSQYVTFRMISTGSPGWKRKKTPGKFLADKVNKYVAKVAPMAFQAYVDGMKG